MSDTQQQQPAAFTPDQEDMLERLAQRARNGLAQAASPDPAQVQPTAPEASTWRRILRDLGTGIAEAPGQITRGALEAADAVSGAAWAGAAGAADLLGAPDTASAIRGVRRRSLADAAASTGFVGGEAQSVTGGLVNEVSQFLTGFYGVGAVARTAGIVQATTTGGRIAQGMGQGGFADALAFQGNEDRLSNLIESVPALQNPVTAYLAASPDDGEAEGRFKAALEGLALGGLVEGLFAAVRGVKRARNGDAPGAVEDFDAAAGAQGPRQADPLVDENVARQMDEEAAREAEQLELDLQGGSVRGEAEAQAVRDNPDADPLASVQPTTPTYAPRLEMDPERLRSTIQLSIREQGYGGGRDIAGIRTDLIENNGDLAATIGALRIEYRAEYEKLGIDQGPRTLDQVRRTASALAEEVGGEPDLILRRMMGQFDNLQHADAEMLMYRDFLASIHSRVVRYARALNNPQGTDLAGFGDRVELGNQFQKHVELLANVSAMYKGIQTNIARSLNAMRMQARIDNDLVRELHNVEKLAARFAQLDERDVIGGRRLAQGGFLRNAMGVVNEYWINSILSGPKTHLINVASGLATSVLQPAERMLGGAMTFNREQFLEGGLQYVGLVMSVRDAAVMSAKALRDGNPILDPTRLPTERRSAITAVNLNAPDGLAGGLVDFLGNVIRMPSRLLMTQDEFFKQLTYRARIRAQAWREAMEAGHAFDSQEFADLVASRMQAAFDGAGQGIDAGHMTGARSITFADDLDAPTWFNNRTIGSTLQAATAEHPFLQLILPFVRTPTNILRFAADRTPGLNVLRRQYAQDLSGANGREAQGMAAAKMATGGVLWGAALSFALDGTITGGGPSDPFISRQLRETGWRPYSVRIQNEDGTVSYRAYNRLDPFASIFGIAADYAEVASFMGDRDAEQLATDMMVAVARNLQTKTYLSGVTNAVRALAEPDKRGERFIQSLAGSFVPAAVQRTMRDDPHLREVRSVLDALRNRMPGSQGMDPVRNVLGEAVATTPGWGPDWISPIAETVRPGGAQPTTREWRNAVQPDVHGEIARQLVRHNGALRPPPPMFGQVDLREYPHPETGRSAYDRYQELVGEVTVRGVTIKDRLQALIKSDAYQNRATDGTFDHDGSRIDMIRQVVGAYRQIAERQLRREMPDLDDALRADERLRALTKVQRTAPVQ